MVNLNARKSKVILGNDILKILKLFGETEWSRFSPVVRENNLSKDIYKIPHFTLWRWKNPNPELDKSIVEAVNSFEGQVKWKINSRERISKLGGTNWGIEPLRVTQVSNEFKDLNYSEIEELIAKEEPGIGILSNQDVPKLAEHIKRYIEENRQSSDSSQSKRVQKTSSSHTQPSEEDLYPPKPVYPPRPDHIIPAGIEGLLTVYFAKEYDELVKQYGKMRLITQIVAKYKEEQDPAAVRHCLNEVVRLLHQEHDEKYLRNKIVNEYGVKIPISQLGGAYKIFLERLHEELVGKRLYN
jgi:hypothetical protein